MNNENKHHVIRVRITPTSNEWAPTAAVCPALLGHMMGSGRFEVVPNPTVEGAGTQVLIPKESTGVSEGIANITIFLNKDLCFVELTPT